MSNSFKTSVDLDGEDIHWEPEGGLSYGRYLDIDTVLGAQHPVTGEHDEMMFIIIHQASELWMKLCLHELDATSWGKAQAFKAGSIAVSNSDSGTKTPNSPASSARKLKRNRKSSPRWRPRASMTKPCASRRAAAWTCPMR